MNPSAPHHRFVPGAQGVQVFTRSWHGDDGPPFVFVHSWSGSHASWEHQYEGPASVPGRIVALDTRGSGYSEKPVDPDGYLDGRVLATDLDAVLRAYDLSDVILVGASIGGIIVADYLSSFGTQRVRGVVLVGSLFAIGQEAGPLWMGPAAGLAFQTTTMDFTLQYEALKAFVRASGAPLDEGEVERQAAISLMTPPHVRAALLRRDVDHSGTWAQFDRPLWLVHGENDQVVPLTTAKAFAKRAAHARVHIVEDGGHLVFRERPAEFNAALVAFRDELAIG